MFNRRSYCGDEGKTRRWFGQFDPLSAHDRRFSISSERELRVRIEAGTLFAMGCSLVRAGLTMLNQDALPTNHLQFQDFTSALRVRDRRQDIGQYGEA